MEIITYISRKYNFIILIYTNMELQRPIFGMAHASVYSLGVEPWNSNISAYRNMVRFCSEIEGSENTTAQL